jgi:hypothetical protein
MTIALDIIRDAHRLLGITVVAHNECEMIRLINEALDEMQREIDNKLTGEK